jgi:type IV pilus assembly protein PilC
MTTIEEFFQLEHVRLLLAGLFWVAFWLLPACGLACLGYFLLSLPLRRHERGRFFIDLLESNLKQGRSVEQTIIEIAASRDRTLGARFHLLAAHLENGRKLSEALKKVPRLLPPQMSAMLQVGERIGDLAKVLPACRACLRDGLSQLRSAINYLFILALLATPTAVVVRVLATFVWPKFQQIFADMDVPVSPLAVWVMEQNQWISVAATLVTLLVYLSAFLYIGGPRVLEWLEEGMFPASHWVVTLLPWRRKRLQRDFSAMLALLLDAGMPEETAVTLAGESTANRAFQRRARKVVEDLRAGVKLTEALLRLDDAGEFRWRLANAVHAHGGFLSALRGWLEWLDAKAFQQQQAAAQAVTTALVLFNGVMVGSVVVGIFDSLVAIIREGILW